jgi:GNAT superfamily N-acetyltransferase
VGQPKSHRLALADGGGVLASAKLYAFGAVLDGRPVRVLGIGAVFTQPAHRGRGHGRDLVGRIVDRASRDGVDVALLFSEIGDGYYSRIGFESVSTTDLVLRVKESARHGAPATLVRSGEPRDFADIVSMGRVRSKNALTSIGFGLVQYDCQETPARRTRTGGRARAPVFHRRRRRLRGGIRGGECPQARSRRRVA